MSGLPEQPSSPASPTSKKPDDTAFKQQRLPAWHPTYSPPFVIGCFLTIGIAFIPIGAAIIVASDSINELALRYDHLQACPFGARRPELGYACEPLNFTFSVAQTWKAPVFMFYQLDNFYQNHRRYARSKSDLQLSGEDVPSSALEDCAPFTTPGQYSLQDANLTALYSSTVSIDLRSVVYNPCGLIAWSMFNDSFRLTKEDSL